MLCSGYHNMGCSLETAKQRNQCSINGRSNSSEVWRANPYDNQRTTYKKEQRQSSSCAQSGDIKTGADQSAEEEQADAAQQESQYDFVLPATQQRNGSAAKPSSSSERVFGAFNDLSLRCGSRRCNHNCHCSLTNATSGHKSNNNDSCPIPIPSVGANDPRPPLPLVTAANSSIITTATITLPKKPQKTATAPTVTTTTACISPSLSTRESATTLPSEDVAEPQELYADAMQQLQFERVRGCLHSYRNATEATRGVAATMAAVCANSSFTVHEVLSHARNVLTTRLVDVSNKVIDNISYYAETAAVATTTNCTTAAQQHQIRKKKRKKHQHPQHLQQQEPQRHHQHCNRHYCQRDAPLTSPISKASISSPSPSPTLACSNCGISSTAATSPSATTASASASVSATSGNESSSAAATAAYNYIGHNYYHLLRNTISFYAASSVILVLCYLTTTTSAAAANSETAPLEPHPIVNIDWSKFDESSSDKEILDLLLEKKRYDKRLLPPVNGTLTVNVNVLLLSLASPDESSLKYEVEFLLNQQWSDPRLQYGNKSHYNFLNALHHHDSIWTPDTYFIMHGDFKDPIIPMHFALRIYRNGTITYAMRRHLILSCQGSLHIFPFDDPKCSFSMESISYEVAQIKYVWKNDEDTLRKSPSLTSLNAYLIKNQTTACEQTSWRGNYSCLRVDLIFTRDRAFYFTTVFIPGIILVTSSFITFWLEWNAVPARSMIGNYSCLQVALTFTRDRAYYFTTVFIPGIILVTSSFITFWLEWNAVPARVMIGVTTMLNFFTTSNGFRSTLPVVSNLTAMNVWDGVCMCFIYASLLEFVCVNYVGRKRPLHNVVYRPGENPVTQRLPAVLSRIGVILASPLEIIEREFQTALSSEKAAAGFSSASGTIPQTPTSATSHIHWERHYKGGGMIGAAVKNLRARSMRRRCNKHDDHSRSKSQSSRDNSPIRRRTVHEPETETESEHIYAEATMKVGTDEAHPSATTTVTVEDDMSHEVNTFSMKSGVTAGGSSDDRGIEVHIYSDTTSDDEGAVHRKRSHSIATNTPPLIIHSGGKGSTHVDIHVDSSPSRSSTGGAHSGTLGVRQKRRPSSIDIESVEHGTYPVRPPRKKTSRSTSPTGVVYDLTIDTSSGSPMVINGDPTITKQAGRDAAATEHVRFAANTEHGEKRRDAGAPNEIVACTTCGGSSSPCTHSANNGCATETCFVQVRKKEPPHPIRVAKTIDVIARITFPTAYAIFLIFFFVHYKGFS